MSDEKQKLLRTMRMAVYLEEVCGDVIDLGELSFLLLHRATAIAPVTKEALSAMNDRELDSYQKGVGQLCLKD